MERKGEGLSPRTKILARPTSLLNDDVDVRNRMSDGRLFHARGPATANARSPMVERRVEGTTRSADDTERRRRRVVATGTASSETSPTPPWNRPDPSFEPPLLHPGTVPSHGPSPATETALAEQM